MTRIVLFSGTGPAGGFAAGAWRLLQLVRLYRQLGRPVDLVLAPDVASEADLLMAWDLFDRVAISGPGGADAGMLCRFSLPEGWQLAHVLGPGGPREGQGRIVQDLCGGRTVGHADLVAATSDIALGAHLDSGRGIRLPWLPPPLPRMTIPAAPQGPIGWVGPGGRALAEGWSTLLEAIWRRQGGWPGGVLLGGAWAGTVVVPPAFQGVRRIPAPDNPEALFRALALAALPGPVTGGEDMAICAALRRGIPVLALDAAARDFGDRWRLARPGTPEEMADCLVARGVSGVAPPEEMAAATAEMDRDGAAMEAHFLDRVAALLAQ